MDVRGTGPAGAARPPSCHSATTPPSRLPSDGASYPLRRPVAVDKLEGLAQPTITILIKQLEGKGLVRRTRQSGDGRVVLVSLTESGNVALEDYRGRLRVVLGGYLAEIADEQVEALATATETLAQLVGILQQRPAR